VQGLVLGLLVLFVLLMLLDRSGGATIFRYQGF
jgi:hypothetical protein